MENLCPRNPKGIYKEIYDTFIDFISSECIASGCKIEVFPYYRDKDYSVIAFRSKTGTVFGHVVSSGNSFLSAAIKYIDSNSRKEGLYYYMSKSSFYDNSEPTVDFFKILLDDVTFKATETHIIYNEEHLEAVRNFCKAIMAKHN